MFAELHTKSHYTFLTGASSPEELVLQSSALGYSAIAITDECSYAGLVKAYKASRECGIKLIVGSEFSIAVGEQHLQLVLLAPTRLAYSEISALITKGRRRSAKGEYSLSIADLRFGLRRCLAIWIPKRQPCDTEHGKLLEQYFRDRLWLGVELFWHSNDQQHYLYCEQLSRACGTNMVACNDVHMHHKSRKPLQDTLTAIKQNTTIQQLGKARQINAERYLKPISVLQHQYPAALLEESLRIADLCHFSMTELQYEYPREVVPENTTPAEYLREVTYQGAALRWPNGVPAKAKRIIEYELGVIHELKYEYYFLTVYDIVAFARSQNILCQGRGSAANSAVCYCLYITEIDPETNQLLFERFISKERNEPPDIDVDFESQRREEVIQYIYQKYSRKRTALTATVITYRRKSAVRDVGKALGLPLNFIEELNRSMAWWDKIDALTEQMQSRKMTFSSSLSMQFFTLVKEILGTPRHLSQHVGGFLITHSPTSTLVPIENAAMPDRTIIQWDKYDIEILGLLKVDILGLGMLSAIRRALAMIGGYQKQVTTLQEIPKEDPKVYDMLCAGDSVGVFQVESRAQMSMLPRLKPRCFYDLVIEVAIVRPGPIQGDMVHPYLKRRNGEEPVVYPNKEIKMVLERTLGIPIFQEQVIQLTMVAAGFTGGEADHLRRAMASWGKHGDIGQFEERLISGMLARGHSQDFAERLFKQIQGFGSYGFPESHSASFALLVYVSSWLKRYHPAAFYAGILNSQPMGFYSPSQLIQDARRHNIMVLPVCINHSDWEHSLDHSQQQPALRLGLRLIKGVSEATALRIMAARQVNIFSSIEDVKTRALMNSEELMKLVNANAFHQFDSNRRRAYWQSLQVDDGLNTQKSSNADFIQDLQPVEQLLADYQHARGVSLDHHPMQLLRNKPPFKRCTTANNLLAKRNNSLIEVSGVVTGRQRPGTASGVIFLTLEDETGNINVVLWKSIQDRFRQEILSGRILYIKGSLEHQHGVANVVAGYIEQLDHALPSLKTHSRNFH
ncbi:error-prone DNA polymerase [Arenicella xantha]|uniref:Error-prone DNA polymerase n=1 Tax=Arenicella xantha TaxID=644221 RepID=A0A395JKI9_9GAMM|nr:error-prone DNA polymerase [Arenicella xantha]RBP49392.1 error-prone DNA polymerase [Arenicella xantha]